MRGRDLHAFDDVDALGEGAQIVTSGNVDEDYFSLGTVEAGETVFSRVTIPEDSGLLPVIEIRNASNQVVSINPNPTDASIARYDISETGAYYVVILGQGGQGPQGERRRPSQFHHEPDEVESRIAKLI